MLANTIIQGVHKIYYLKSAAGLARRAAFHVWPLPPGPCTPPGPRGTERTNAAGIPCHLCKAKKQFTITIIIQQIRIH